MARADDNYSIVAGAPGSSRNAAPHEATTGSMAMSVVARPQQEMGTPKLQSWRRRRGRGRPSSPWRGGVGLEVARGSKNRRRFEAETAGARGNFLPPSHARDRGNHKEGGGNGRFEGLGPIFRGRRKKNCGTGRYTLLVQNVFSALYNIPAVILRAVRM